MTITISLALEIYARISETGEIPERQDYLYVFKRRIQEHRGKAIGGRGVGIGAGTYRGGGRKKN